MNAHVPLTRYSEFRRHRIHAPHLLLVLAIAALSLCQVLDGIFTATGLLFLNIALPVPVLGRAGVAVMLALSLQLTALALDIVLSTAAFRTPWPLRAPAIVVAVLVLCSVQGLAGFLHFTQLENLSAGSNLRQALVYDATSLNARVRAVNRQIAARYQTAVNEEWTLARQSRAGEDASGIPICGPRCKTAIHRARVLESRFATLAQPMPGAQTAFPADATHLFATLQQRIDLVRSKLPTYEALCATMHWTCTDPLAPTLKDPVYQRLVTAMTGHQIPDRQRLVLQHVDRELHKLAHGSATAITIVISAIVALWPAMEFALLLAIRLALVARRDAELASLREEHDHLEEIIDLQSKISALDDVESILQKTAGT